MSENNLPNMNDDEQNIQDEVNEVETTEQEATKEVVETADNSEDTYDAVIVEKKDSKKVWIIASVVLAVALVASVITGGFGTNLMKNKYNEMGYGTVDITVKDVAQELNMPLKEFLQKAHLPANLPADTLQSAAFYGCLPAEAVALISGMTFDQMKEELQLPDTVTEKTLWGEAEGQSPLKAYVGEDNLDQFKQQYKLGDEVTGDTLWKDVRKQVNNTGKNGQYIMQWQQVIGILEKNDAGTGDAATTPATSAGTDEATPAASAEASPAA